MARSTRIKALSTEADRNGFVLVPKGRTSRNVEPATVVAASDIAVIDRDKRLARYMGQADFWRGKMSKGQTKRLSSKGIKFTAKTLAWQASEANAQYEAKANGTPFLAVTRF